MPLGRVMAIVHTALHDAAIAAWDAQVAHARPSPGATSDKITPAAGVDPDQPSFPSEHAAVAGAAAAVLAYLLEEPRLRGLIRTVTDRVQVPDPTSSRDGTTTVLVDLPPDVRTWLRLPGADHDPDDGWRLGELPHPVELADED